MNNPRRLCQCQEMRGWRGFLDHLVQNHYFVLFAVVAVLSSSFMPVAGSWIAERTTHLHKSTSLQVAQYHKLKIKCLQNKHLLIVLRVAVMREQTWTCLLYDVLK